MNSIGTLSEKSLHAALKSWYARPGDALEVPVDNYVIDIVRGDLLIEIQTGNFSAMKQKLTRLLHRHRLRLVHPIPQEKWIVRQTATGEPLSRRKSPKRGRVVDLFGQLVYLPGLLAHPNLDLEVLLTRQEEILRADGRGSWRRKHWSLHDHHLLAVIEQVRLTKPADYLALVPPELARPFTNHQLAAALGTRYPTAQKMTYTLYAMDLLTIAGKQGRSRLYEEKPR